MNICVFASGSGSNFKAIIESKKSGYITSGLSLLITNNSLCGAAEHARQNGIDVCHISRAVYKDLSDEEYAGIFINKLKEYSIDVILLAGYMKKIDSRILRHYERRIINIHPALLPAFGGPGMYGINVHKAVIESGIKLTGITIHFVNEQYDAGEIILQKTTDVKEDDDAEKLQKRVLKFEHKYYSEVIKEIETGKIKIGKNFS